MLFGDILKSIYILYVPVSVGAYAWCEYNNDNQDTIFIKITNSVRFYIVRQKNTEQKRIE